MSEALGTIEQLAGELARMFDPLAQRVEDDTVDTLFEWLGLRSSDATADATELAGALTTTATAAASMPELIAALAKAIEDKDGAAIASSSLELLRHIGTLIQAAREVGTALQAISAGAGLTPQQK